MRVFVVALVLMLSAPTAWALNAEDSAAIALLQNAQSEGLAVGDLPTISRRLTARSPTLQALGHRALDGALRLYAIAESGQRIVPEAIDPDWAITPAPVNVDAGLALSGAARIAWLQSLRPAARQYLDLVAQRERYAAYAAGDGWPSLDDGPNLREGDTNPRVIALRRRLVAEGYVTPEPASPAAFDSTLSAALQLFQTQHGLEADGILGAATRDALNVTAEARLRQIDANLERWRWLPRTIPADRVEVNIAAADLTLYRNDVPALRMRTIVGATDRRTPMFVAAIDAVVLNPSWNVPASIARNELFPAAARDPTYFERRGFTVTDGRIVQRPGPDNALGQVKFDMQSPQGVYLHDTPSRALFDRPVRMLSHGCVRIAAPRELAEQLLSPTGVGRGAIEGGIAGASTQRLALATPMPVYLLYWTAFVGEDGALRFTGDGYGWDDALDAALHARTAPVAIARSGSATCATRDTSWSFR